MRIASIAFVILLAPLTGCAFYDLDVEGKRCALPEHPCPAGYQCVPSADGGSVCKKGAPDGGPDGADAGPCREGQTACPSYEELAVCRDGKWDYQECAEGEYCFDPGGQMAADCIALCTGTSDCTDIVDDYYCDEDGRCKPKGDCTDSGVVVDQDRCSPDLKQVLHCSSETGVDEVVDTCTTGEYCDVYQKACLSYCDDDSGCNPGSSCNPKTRKCIPMNLCQSDADCPGAICVGAPAGACVKPPTTQVTTHGGAADLECYTGDPPADTGPASCRLTGRVVKFFSRLQIEYDPAIEVALHPIEQVLSGTPGEPSHRADVTDDGSGMAQYTFDSVPTGATYVMSVSCDGECSPYDLHTLYTFSVYLRADECQAGGGQIDMGAPALLSVNYPTYNEAAGVSDPDRGLLLGWLKDCKDPSDKIENGTGGISMDHEILYYLPVSGAHDLEDTDTNPPGFFAAANVMPIRGVAGALVLDQSSPVSLRARPVRVFPGQASLVVFDKPKKPAD